MNYTEALEYIHGTLKFGSKLGLHNIGRLLELMGNPQKKMKFVHVAGTNGKGSTVAFISSILIESGYKVGIYTSPYLQRFTERIRINNTEIPENELVRLTEFVKEKVEIMVSKGENHPTEFEIVTAIAFQYYYEAKCDIVVLEVGLGGRFDATNIIDTPVVSVITTISFDHTDRLGNTLPQIAFEKAGIIKECGNVVIYPQPEEVEIVFHNICEERNAQLHKVDFTSLVLEKFDVDGQAFIYKNYDSLKISLLGPHQVKNAAVAVDVVELLVQKGFNISQSSIKKGLMNTRWPGRLEVVGREPVFLIDGAHNAEGARTLSETLNLYFPNKRKIFITGVLKDKDYKTMLESVIPIADVFITVTPESDRALPAKDLAIFIRDYCKNVLISDTIEEAIRTSLKISSQDDLICSFGSLYYIGKVREYFETNCQ